MTERVYWLGFSAFPGVGPLRFSKLLGHFGSAQAAWQASKADLLASGLGEKLTAQFLDFRQKHSLIGYENYLKQKNITTHLLTDTSYPQKLSRISNPPFVLYVKSRKLFNFNARENEKTIGVVGTRKITNYGRQVTEEFTTDLVSSGCVIVSGLALGVDGVAHQATIDQHGNTIAVLGCGVDCCTPREHQHLYESILQNNGAIVSEFPPGQPPNKGSFPSRNRIISGLSLGILVTEGAANSGSLITATDALKQGRKVFAVPGPITSSLSKGPNSLIAKGGKMVLSANDILQELEIKSTVSAKRIKSIKSDSKEEQQIIDLLSEQNLHVDELVRKTDTTASQLSGILTVMEMKGLITILETGIVVLVLM